MLCSFPGSARRGIFLVKMLCEDCPKKSLCKSPCKELELHLKQIEIPQRELTIGNPVYGGTITPRTPIHFTPREKEIVTLLGKGLLREEVCQALNITPNNLRQRLFKLKEKYREK